MSLTNSISYTAASRGLKSEICYWALWWTYQKAAFGEPDPVPRVPGATQSILCCCAVGAFPALPLAAGSTRPWKQCAIRITTTAAAMVNGCLLSAALLRGEMQALRRAHREGVRRSSEPCFSQPHGSWQLWLLTLAPACLGRNQMLRGRAALGLFHRVTPHCAMWPWVLSCSLLFFPPKKVDPLFLCDFPLWNGKTATKSSRQSQPGAMLPWEIVNCSAQRNYEIFTGRINSLLTLEPTSRDL